jgi:hypothetical protein
MKSFEGKQGSSLKGIFLETLSWLLGIMGIEKVSEYGQCKERRSTLLS